jgi:DNA-binding response OmpR family regulator
MQDMGRMRVLIVEDNEPVRHMIALLLRRNGFIALEAGNAAQALVHFEKESDDIHLAIIDLMGTRGLDLAAQIDRDYGNTRILYISGFVDSVAAEAIRRRSPETLLLKPFHERALIDHVYRLVGPPQSAAVAKHGQRPARE